LLAFEIARQLRAAGEDVAQLVIIDALPPGSAPLPSAELPNHLPGKIKDVIGLLGTGLIPNPGLGHYWRFHRQARTLIRRYRPRPYEGSALVLVVDGPERQLRSAWQRWVVGGLEVRVTPGDHHSLGRDPFAGDLAAAIQRE
jgi:thioesterase domain-containing protein